MKKRIVITSLPRSGSSFLMKFFEKGGVKVVTDNYKKPTNANPNGFYETREMEFHPEWLVDEMTDGCIKVLIPQVDRLGDRNVKYIFIERDIEEIADSFNKMHRADVWAMSLLASKSRTFLKDKDVTYINYNRIIENPRHELSKIKDLVPDFEEALKVVDKSLYRSRKLTDKALTKEDLEKRKEALQKEIKNIDKLLEAFEEVLCK